MLSSNLFYGDKGYMVINGYDNYKTFLGRERTPGPARNAGGDHYKNFIDAVRAHDPKLLNGPIETGHLSASLAHLGNIAYRLGRTLKFDPENEKFWVTNKPTPCSPVNTAPRILFPIKYKLAKIQH